MNVVSAAGRTLGQVVVVEGDDVFVEPDETVVDGCGYRVSAQRRQRDFRLETDDIDRVTGTKVQLVEF